MNPNFQDREKSLQNILYCESYEFNFLWCCGIMDEEEGGIINTDYASFTEHVDDISAYQESLENQTNGVLNQFINNR